jgi:tripartite-type tricarboxylate transporter receptor subunit TctC
MITSHPLQAASVRPERNSPVFVLTRTYPLAMLLLVLHAVSSVAAAADPAYPERPIRLIVPSAAAGSPDTIMRTIANQVTKQVKQQIVIDNRPGGSYTIGTMALAKAPADGYTIAYANLTSLVMNRFYLDEQPLYSIDKDLAPVVQTHYQPNVLAVSPSLPVRSVKALIDYAKANPGKLLYGSSGNGTSSHVSAELFKSMTGTQMEHVPYKGAQQANIDLMGGQIQLTFNNVVTMSTLIKSKKLNALGITGPKRSPLFPDLPTIAESGVPGYEFTVWGGLIVPAGTPNPVIAKLNAEVNKAFQVPAIQEQFDGLGNTLVGGTPAAFSAFIERETKKWAPIIPRIKLKAS